MRVVAVLAAVAVAVVAASAGRAAGGWRWASASAYSWHSSGLYNGCDGSRLQDSALTVATFLVPCGGRVQICYRARCVVATRRDSGPYVAGRGFDLNRGVVRALGVRDEYAWGVRDIRWRPVT